MFLSKAPLTLKKVSLNCDSFSTKEDVTTFATDLGHNENLKNHHVERWKQSASIEKSFAKTSPDP